MLKCWGLQKSPSSIGAAENVYSDFDLPQPAFSGPDGWEASSQDIK